MSVISVIGSVLIGVLVGVLSGLLGIGGGTIMVPLFRLGFGLSAIAATATSLFAVLPASISGFVTHWKNHTMVPMLGLAAGIAGACMSPVGVMAADHSPSWLIMSVAGLVICYSAFTMIKKALVVKAPASKGVASSKALQTTEIENAVAGDAATTTVDAAPAIPSVSHLKTNRARFIKLGVISGVIAGLGSGYIGVGGAFIMVPLFLSYAGISMREASGTSLLAVVLIAIPGVITQMMLGHVEILLALALCIGSIPGAILGANLVKYVPERVLRLGFGVFLVFVALFMVVNEFLGVR